MIKVEHTISTAIAYKFFYLGKIDSTSNREYWDKVKTKYTKP